jgi:Arc/MetJ family transcription regulator
MTKRLVDIDDRTLRVAQRRLRTRTIKETVHRALQAAAGAHPTRVKKALDVLASARLRDREQGWR